MHDLGIECGHVVRTPTHRLSVCVCVDNIASDRAFPGVWCDSTERAHLSKFDGSVYVPTLWPIQTAALAPLGCLPRKTGSRGEIVTFRGRAFTNSWPVSPAPRNLSPWLPSGRATLRANLVLAQPRVDLWALPQRLCFCRNQNIMSLTDRLPWCFASIGNRMRTHRPHTHT